MASHRDIWLWIGGAMLLLAAVAASIAGTFLATRQNYAFWTSGPMIGAYVLAALAFLCLLAAVNTVPFPPWSNRAMEASASPAAEARPREQPAESAPILARAIVDVDPEYLMGLYREHTSIQAERLAEIYIGKWLRVTGELGDVSPMNEFFSQVTFVFKIGSPNIYMYFRDRAQVDRLSLLRRGTPIAVLGRIERIRESFLDLGQCELDEVARV